MLALARVPGVGPIVAKKLIAYCGGPEEVFRKGSAFFERIPGIGKVVAKAVAQSNLLDQAQREMNDCRRHGLRIVTFLDKDFPQRLNHCPDAPLLLYVKGTADLNSQRSLSIVGTRNATAHGKEATERIVEELAPLGITIVSGLAYGIDIVAHRAALKHGLPTIACLAHGLDRIYPPPHANTAKEMLELGGLISEYPIGTNPDRENFPTRNRIVAGMTDATLVVEAGIKGGALITARLASDYDRDVFAIPGRVSDVHSEGCNRLIKENRAALVTCATDIITSLNWDMPDKSTTARQQRLLIDLTPDQERIVEALRESSLSVDMLAARSKMPMSKVSALLLEMEFDGMVRNLPGKVYQLV
ncbi:MAG: DNA-processing protein DprA [Flavobacteriales bacterium]|nr:DNA-processing protein DprA [Flavobacteriales bacterium]